MKKNFSPHIQIIRGISIIAVVFIHTTSLYSGIGTNQFINLTGQLMRFAVPLFIFVSGYLHPVGLGTFSLLSTNTRRFIFQKFFRICIPYFSFSVLYMTIRIIMEHLPGLATFTPIKYTSVSNVLMGIMNPLDNPGGHLYFLPLLFFTIVLFTCLQKYLHPRVTLLLMVSAVLSAIGFSFFEDIHRSINPLHGLLFYSLGYWFQHYNQTAFVKRLRHPISIAGAVVIFTTLVIFRDSLPGITSLPVYYLIKYIIGILCIDSLVWYYCNRHTQKRKKAFDTVLTKLGDYSYDIYLLHEPYILTILFKLSIFLIPHLIYFLFPELVLISLLIPIFISSLIIKKIPLLSFWLQGNRLAFVKPG